MALSTASLVALAAAVTAAEDATGKTTALMAGLVAATVEEMSGPSVVTPNQLNHVAALQAEVADNIADFVAALEV